MIAPGAGEPAAAASPERRTGARALLIAGLLLIVIAIVGAVDVLTPLYGFSLFYLIPIAIGAWALPTRLALVLPVAAAAMWSFADLSDRTADTMLVTAWNGFTRLVIFSGAALLLGLLRQRERQSADLEVFRRDLLQLIDDQVPARLERVRTLTRRAGKGDRAAQSELVGAVDDVVRLTDTVVALSLIASGTGAASSDVAAVVGEAVRSAGAGDRCVVGSLPAARAKIDPRLLRFIVSGVLVAGLRTTDAYVRLAGSRGHGHVVVTCEIDASGRERSARGLADLLNAISTARSVLTRIGASVGVQEKRGATLVELVLPEAGH